MQRTPKAAFRRRPAQEFGRRTLGAASGSGRRASPLGVRSSPPNPSGAHPSSACSARNVLDRVAACLLWSSRSSAPTPSGSGMLECRDKSGIWCSRENAPRSIGSSGPPSRRHNADTGNRSQSDPSRSSRSPSRKARKAASRAQWRGSNRVLVRDQVHAQPHSSWYLDVSGRFAVDYTEAASGCVACSNPSSD